MLSNYGIWNMSWKSPGWDGNPLALYQEEKVGVDVAEFEGLVAKSWSSILMASVSSKSRGKIMTLKGRSSSSLREICKIWNRGMEENADKESSLLGGLKFLTLNLQ